MDGFPFKVEVIKTKRKRSASIDVVGECVQLRVPVTLSDERIRDLVTKRTAWIKSKLRSEAQRPPVKPREYVSGESFPYLGKNYRLKVIKGDVPSVKMKNGYLVTTIAEAETEKSEQIKPMLEGWYRSHAERRLKEKADRFSKIIGVSPSSISVTSYKSRWGSCSSKGDISFNWKIIRAPHRLIDYVVVHELCHLLELNHSTKYWKHVARYVPDWRECRHLLRGSF